MLLHVLLSLFSSYALSIIKWCCFLSSFSRSVNSDVQTIHELAQLKRESLLDEAVTTT